MFEFITNQFKRDKDKKDYLNEGAEDQKTLLTLTMKDDELVREIDNDILRAKPLYETMKMIQDENELYYLGKQLDKNRFRWELPAGENLLYANLETIISIISAKRKDPIVIPAQKTDESRDLGIKTQQYLTWKWNEQDMIVKYEDWVRHAELYRIGVLKVRFDQLRDDYEILNIRPQRIMIDRDATDEFNAKFIVEFKEDNLETLIRMFPTAKADLNKSFGEKLGTLIKYVEYWTNEFVVWKVNNIVLDKKKNPNWNWDESKKTKGVTKREQSLKELKERWAGKAKNEKLENLLLNYFNEPRKPYIILSLKSLNKDIYADTSDFEQGKLVQDIINRRKRQIDKGAIRALGREVYSGSSISKEEAKKSIANPNSPIWVEKGKASDMVSIVAPAPVSPVLFSDLGESKTALDDVMGVHGTTKGERGPQETATGRKILKEGDLGRIDLSVRRIDKKLELLYSWMLQMPKVWWDEEHFIKIMGAESAAEYLKFSTNDIEDGQEIMVKSEMTVDKSTDRMNATVKLQGGLIDPLTYYEKFDEPNPKELARRLVFYMTDPKLYIQQFCVDENTEGAENDPVIKAKQESQQMMQGEIVPPWQRADQLHIEEHNRFMQSGEFTKSDDIEIKNNYAQHVRAEIEIVRGQIPRPQVAPRPAGPTGQPAGGQTNQATKTQPYAVPK